MRRTGTRPLGVAALCAALLIGAGAARADDVISLDANITAMDRNVTPIDDRVTEGGTTTITLESDVLFDFGSAELSEAAQKKIGEVVGEIPEGGAVSVDGHTDDVPYHRGNDVLSQERAQAVADAIAAARPDLDLTVTGHGDTDPVAPNSKGGEDNPEGRAENRRVEIRYDG